MHAHVCVCVCDRVRVYMRVPCVSLAVTTADNLCVGACMCVSLPARCSLVCRRMRGYLAHMSPAARQAVAADRSASTYTFPERPHGFRQAQPRTKEQILARRRQLQEEPQHASMLQMRILYICVCAPRYAVTTATINAGKHRACLAIASAHQGTQVTTATIACN